MAEHHRELGEDAARIANWLVDNREQFEQSGISEDSIGGLAGVSGSDAVQTAIDQLENKEVVVRDPEELTRPPRFTIKPGRSWPETRDALLHARSTAG
jgi:hypothetical protein